MKLCDRKWQENRMHGNIRKGIMTAHTVLLGAVWDRGSRESSMCSGARRNPVLTNSRSVGMIRPEETKNFWAMLPWVQDIEIQVNLELCKPPKLLCDPRKIWAINELRLFCHLIEQWFFTDIKLRNIRLFLLNDNLYPKFIYYSYKLKYKFYYMQDNYFFGISLFFC